jgi:mono/diheme cytochrome c family protein
MKPALLPLLACGTLLVASALLAEGQANGPAGKRAERAEDVYAELSKAPEKVRLRPNPLENDTSALAAGRLLFTDHCAECHGENAEGGKGRTKGPNLRAVEVQNATSGTLFWVLTNGVVRKGMPVWSRLPEPQRWALVRYLKSLGVVEPRAADPVVAAKP